MLEKFRWGMPFEAFDVAHLMELIQFAYVLRLFSQREWIR